MPSRSLQRLRLSHHRRQSLEPYREQAHSYREMRSPVGVSLLAMASELAIYPYRQKIRLQNQKHYLLYLYTKA